jgi:hypothetical protein
MRAEAVIPPLVVRRPHGGQASRLCERCGLPGGWTFGLSGNCGSAPLSTVP